MKLPCCCSVLIAVYKGLHFLMDLEKCVMCDGLELMSIIKYILKDFLSGHLTAHKNATQLNCFDSIHQAIRCECLRYKQNMQGLCQGTCFLPAAKRHGQAEP